MTDGPTSHTYFSQRLRLHYVDWGNPEAPPLLLVHGGCDHCRSWDWVAEHFRHDWHVIAPDLRGHGDSEWSADGEYSLKACLYDLAQLIHQKNLSPVTIVAHSFGGNLALRFTGTYPEFVRKLVVIEGLGPSPKLLEEKAEIPIEDRLKKWIDQKRDLSGRTPKRYSSLADAKTRMKAANSYLTDDQAEHLTLHGTHQNEDGTWSWKFDNYMRSRPAYDMDQNDLHRLWSRITCPTLLLYGADSWASNPEKDGRLEHFNNAEVIEYEKAGHWLHHDQYDRFVADVGNFIK